MSHKKKKRASCYRTCILKGLVELGIKLNCMPEMEHMANIIYYIQYSTICLIWTSQKISTLKSPKFIIHLLANPAKGLSFCSTVPKIFSGRYQLNNAVTQIWYPIVVDYIARGLDFWYQTEFHPKTTHFKNKVG